jgi:hypothetical protein
MIMREGDLKMKSFVIAATAAVVLSGIGLGGAAEAASYKYRHGRVELTQWERVAIARDQRRVNAIKRGAWADGRVTPWERMRIRAAEARHNALVYRYRHN